jgi:hypothetical protein
VIIEHRPVLTLTQKGFKIIRIVCGVYGSEECEVNGLIKISSKYVVSGNRVACDEYSDLGRMGTWEEWKRDMGQIWEERVWRRVVACQNPHNP